MSKMDDPLGGQELSMLNAMLSKLWPSARDGDAEAIDRVIKILQMKRRYHEDEKQAAQEWKL